MSVASDKRAERDQAIERLREILEPGDTVWTVLRHVSRSGMSRAIDCYVLHDSDRTWISPHVAKAIGARFNEKYEAVEVGGCGMDMGFHVVYSLSRALWPDGFDCIGPFAYLRDDEVKATDYPHIGWFGNDGETPTEIHLPATDMRRAAPGDRAYLPAYLFYRHKCPSNDHVNVRYPNAAPIHHEEGGYALNHRWL